MDNVKDAFDKWLEEGEVENKLAIIQSLSMQGQTMEQIAKAVNLTTTALRKLRDKHAVLRKAIERGRLNVVAICQNKLMEKVMIGDTTAIIYALKVYGGQFFRDNSYDTKIVNTNANQPKVEIYLPATDNGAVENGKKKK